MKDIKTDKESQRPTLPWGITPKCANRLKGSKDFWKMVSHGNVSSDLDVVTSYANDILRYGSDESIVRQIIEDHKFTAKNNRPELPPLFRELLEFKGFNSASALALSLIDSSGLAVLKNATNASPEQIFNINLAANDLTWITLDYYESSWREDCILLENIPESYKQNYIDKPLKDLLSHPVLDKHNIIITDFHESWGDSEKMEVETNLHTDWKAFL